MRTFLQDLRYAVRILRNNPWFTAVALLTLALGMGANTAIFSVVETLLLRPLPLKHADRLVAIWDTLPGASRAPASYPEYLDWKEQGEAFEEIGAFFETSFSLTGHGEPEQLHAIRVSANLVSMLGLAPRLGRGFRPEEEKSGGAPVAMIGYALWKRRFEASPAVLGRSITLAGQPTTVIGVLPPGFPFGNHPEVCIPLRLNPEVAPRGLHFITVLGRLRAGPGLLRARAEVERLAARLRSQGVTRHGIAIVPLQEQMVGETRPALLVLLGAVGFVLLIACTNVANLLLARAVTRRKEIAIRMAVGASRFRLIRQLLTESLTMSVMGAGLGLLLAWWGVDLLVAAGARLPRVEEIGIDSTVLAFTVGVSMLTGILFGLAPAGQASTADFHATLKEGGRHPGAGSGRHRLRSLLVVLEVALSMVLLVGAGLLVRSFFRVVTDEKGFDPRGVLAVEVSLPMSRYEQPEKEAAFFQQLLDRVRAVPGVQSAAVVSHLPLGGDNTNSGLLIEGKTWPEGEIPLADDRLVSADYFRTLRIPVLRGRSFTDLDREGSRRVAVINEALARRFFPGMDPIGKRIDMQWKGSGWQEIVGVVGDLRHDGLDLPVSPTVYASFFQAPDPAMTLVVRTAGNPRSLVGAIRSQVYALDRNQPVSRVRTMEEVIAESVGSRRLSMSLLSGFAALALFLAAVGIYGVTAYSVTQRTHEIGIRMALGARQADVLQLVVGQGLRLVAAGAILGLVAALPLSRLLSSLLFGVSATDLPTFGGVSALLAGVAALACFLPARRAARVDPVTALRYE